MTSIVDLLEHDGWTLHQPATPAEVESLRSAFGVSLPDDYEQLLRRSNGGCLYGFKTPFEFFHTTEVLALYREHDLYAETPGVLLFGGDGGGTLYAFDLRDDRRRVLFFRQDSMSFDRTVFESDSLTGLLEDVLANKKMN